MLGNPGLPLSLRRGACLLAVLLAAPASYAAEFASQVPMWRSSTSTYAVPCEIEGFGQVEMMVDTGSSYMTISRQALGALRDKGLARFVRNLDATLADGSRTVVPVYRLASIRLGDDCELSDVEAAVLPGDGRNLLGLSALNRAGPFVFSTNPPRLTLSHCSGNRQL